MKRKMIIGILLGTAMQFSAYNVIAQTAYSLKQLKEAALKNNHLLAIKDFQVEEKISKQKEDEIKKYPSPTIDGSYQYNFILPEITIPAGALGTMPTPDGSAVPLPAESSKFSVGQKSTFNIGVNLYQPLTQQFKINTLLDIDKADIRLMKKEKEKSAQQLLFAIEQFFYNALIVKKQAEGEAVKLALATAKLKEAEDALAAGKTIKVAIAGLRADIAGQEQRILELDNQQQDLMGELNNLSGLKVSGLIPEETVSDSTFPELVDDYKIAASLNPDMEMAKINKEKAMLGIKAARQSNLPDLGIIAGYYVQQGNPLLPNSSPYVGLSLKWNIQDLFSNSQVEKQRTFQLRQAEESIVYTKLQVESEIDKAWRKLKQSSALILVANKLRTYRKEAYKEQLDKQIAGLNNKITLLEAESQLTEAEVSFYSAQLSRAMAAAQLRNLSGRSK